ncbi:ATP synthase mitochondrial F1 complex assembly factor 2 [Exophiala xenobiotica]|nr:ATP synthase mitochondrial F1 complex assembly factor 2 [Exophiala xenobiotica]KAK5210180.1 ATP synthase mitochondrial F1 complex assembly factor 2 [Exophiala xenobiotica]KAK5228605.1 ATP synthase mitochondrial F1 complex assembly factor 2 [Exophiala xenobiotica]KAK5238326.1 ATP synthase mitochondrial F1 complex assembly factor 2 [Exophiala xenobiotica]KAK5252692.1 ATP synthase mitochondrial F1 complex assembly factor 2 [Exophiala xenobiotica]
MRASTLRVSRCWRSQHSAPSSFLRPLSTTTSQAATALPITATGPPPEPPQPTSSAYSSQLAERRRKAALLQAGKELRAAQSPSASSSSKKYAPLRKRFWKDVHVRTSADDDGLEIYLDSRPVRTPSKSTLKIPHSKPHLAYAIAIEWDMLESAQQALKNHNIPMTSIAARAQDLLESEAQGDRTVRDEIIPVMMRYLDTDTLLCWAPGPSSDSDVPDMRQTGSTGPETLRDRQIRTARPIISFLNTSVWPGVEIKPVLDENSIMPVKQSEVTRSVIQGWIAGLPAYELAALERAVLASKSLLVATRLLIEWSEEFRDLQRTNSETRFGIEEAAEAASLEVKWQTGMWGEVEDSHDVDNEDIRRQLGSAILLASGMSVK